MTESGKRKEPEPQSLEQAASATANGESPDAKRQKTPAQDAEAKASPLKPSAADPKVVRKQVEYYLSDENLKHDKFFHEKISGDPEGWLDLSLVLACNKMKVMHTTEQDIRDALKESTVEIRVGDPVAIRRPGNASLPKFEPRSQSQKKHLHAHDGGVVAVFRQLPEEQSWMQVKEALRKKLPEKVNLWFVSPVSDKGQCMVATAPFEGDLALFEELQLELGGKALKAEICFGELLQQSLKLLPRHIKEKREKEARKRQKDKNKPIVVGTQKFMNVAALRGRVKEILNARSEGEALKVDGTDFKLIRALLEYHPKGAEKSKGLVGIKVGTSSYGDNRCFFIVKEGGEAEDFSAKKCLDAVELNPPYKEDAPKAGTEAPADAAKSDVVKDASATPGPTAEAAASAAAPAAAASAAEPEAAATPSVPATVEAKTA